MTFYRQEVCQHSHIAGEYIRAQDMKSRVGKVVLIVLALNTESEKQVTNSKLVFS